jgi:hypothetical protein
MLAVLGAAATTLAVTGALSGAAVSSHRAPARSQASRGATSRMAASRAVASRAASSRSPGSRMASFRAAARQFAVPVSLLLAIGYDESRWEPHGSMPSADGGYGLMNLTTRTFNVASAQGKTGGKPRRVHLVMTHYTLDEAARLLHVPASTLKTNDTENVRGAAAVLAGYARRLGSGRLPSGLGGWYGAVAEYSGDTQEQTAELSPSTPTGTPTSRQ